MNEHNGLFSPYKWGLASDHEKLILIFKSLPAALIADIHLTGNVKALETKHPIDTK